MVPKLIHFMWYSKSGKNEKYPDRYDKYMISWRKYNPEFTIKIWNNTDIDDFWKLPDVENYREFYSKLKHIEKCDFTRYLIMYIYGGIYIDLNTMCYKNITPLLDRELGLSFEPIEHNILHGFEYLITNSFLISSKGNIFWINLCEFIMKNYWKTNHPTNFIMINTGPCILGKFVISNYSDKLNDIMIPNCLTQLFVNEDKGNNVKTKTCSSNDQVYFSKHWKDTAGWGVSGNVADVHINKIKSKKYIIVSVLLIGIIGVFLYKKYRV